MSGCKAQVSSLMKPKVLQVSRLLPSGRGSGSVCLVLLVGPTDAEGLLVAGSGAGLSLAELLLPFIWTLERSLSSRPQAR